MGLGREGGRISHEGFWGLLKGLVGLGTFGGGVILASVLLLTMAEVVSRYVFSKPLMLCDELGGYGLVAMTFLGLGSAMVDGVHVRIRFLAEKLPQKYARRLRLFTLVLALVYCGIGTAAGVRLAWDSYVRGVKSASWLNVPLVWPQLPIPLGFVLLCVAISFRLAMATRGANGGPRICPERDLL